MSLPGVPLVRRKAVETSRATLKTARDTRMSISHCRSQQSITRPSNGLPTGEFGIVGRLRDFIEYLLSLITRLAEQSSGTLGATGGVFKKEVNLSTQMLALKVECRHGRAQGGQLVPGIDPAIGDAIGIVRPGGERFLSDLGDHVAGLIGRLQSRIGTPHGIFSLGRIEGQHGAPLLRQATGRVGSLTENISPGFGHAIYIFRSGFDRPLGRFCPSLDRTTDTRRTGFSGTPRVFRTGVNNASARFFCLGNSGSRGVTSLVRIASIRHSSPFWVREVFTKPRPV